MVNHTCKHPLHDLGCPLAHDAAASRRGHGIVLAASKNVLHDARPEEDSTIGDGRIGRDQLHRGYPDLLPHGDGSDRDPGPVVWRFEQPALFPRQLDIGTLAETKAAHVAKEPILSQTEP